MGRAARAQTWLRRRRDERGAALVEAAIILPLIMLLTFGAIELGLGFSQRGGLESAARSGARRASTQTAESNDVSETNDTIIGVEAVKAVNAALDSSTIPTLKKLYVFKTGVSTPPTCATDCMVFSPDGTGKHFNVNPDNFGGWPTTDRDACGTTPDRVTVRVEGDFNFLSGLVGTGTIRLVSESTLQLEPTNCG